MRIASLSFISALALAAGAQASQIVYEPVNPLFQPGNALNASIIATTAEPTRPSRSSSSTSLSQRSIAETVRASLVSRISSDLYNDIFGSGASPSGTFDLGDGNIIAFVNDGTNVTITFSDPVNGTTTITVPAS